MVFGVHKWFVCCLLFILDFGQLLQYYFPATEDTDIEKKKKREESEDDTPTKKLPYPKQIFFIISMEACERFSYYGMNSKDTKDYLRTI